LYDYTNGIDPNKIVFSFSLPLEPVASNSVASSINVFGGVPSYIAVLINDTNLADAVWQTYNPNMVVPLSQGNGVYNVLVGLRGLPDDAVQTWQSGQVTRYVVPLTLTVTSPALAGGAASVSVPLIQVQGFASLPVAGITYDLANAAGIFMNQTGYITGQFYDTNLPAFTTNYFQCYDVPLANGLNAITVHAQDLAGNPAATSFNVTLDYATDHTPPALSVVWPTDGTYISGATFTFQGQVDDATAKISAQLVDASGNTNTVAGLVERNGTVWVNNLPVAAGANVLTLTATDAAGNSSTTSLTIYPSSITVTINPLTSDQLNQSSVTVYGTVSDATAQVYVNTIPAMVNDDGTWEADGVPVSATGTAVLNVEVYGGGSSPLLAKAKGATPFQPNGLPSGNPTGSVNLVTGQPSVVQATSYQNHGQYWDQYSGQGPHSGSNPDLTVSIWNINWTLAAGGYSYSHLYDSLHTRDDLSYGVLTTNWMTDASVAWQYVNIPNQLSSMSEQGDYGPETWTDLFSQAIQTKIQLVAGGVLGSGGQQVVRLVTSAFDASGAPLPAAALNFLGQTPTPTATNANVGELFVTMPAGAAQDITPTLNPAYAGNQNQYSFNAQAYDVDLQLAADNNRDGSITFDEAGQTNPDATTPAKPFRFWVNNDRDGYDSSIGDYDDMEPVTGQTDDLNTSIPCTRDLEDYTRLWLNTQGITTELQNGTFLLGLEWKNVTAGTSPSIRLFPAVETNGGTLYLTDETTALAQSNAPYGNCIMDGYGVRTQLQGSSPFIIPTNFWAIANVTTNQPVAHLLFDAVSRGSGQLVVSLYKSDGVTKLSESAPLYLKLQDVKEMYERWTVGSDPTVAPATTASMVTTPYQYDTTITAENNYIMFVHGWNLAQWEKDTTAETAFKRLYWQGYKGHFGAFQWPTTYGITGTISVLLNSGSFDNGEWQAWKSGTGLMNLLTSLNSTYPGNVYLMAHSMGNVVAGEALRLEGSSQVVNTYVAMQGAVASHAYDPNTPTRSLGIFDDNTPDRYAEYYTSGAPCYFNGVHGAGTFVNFYNPVDWALVQLWEPDQNTKPDSLRGYGFVQDTGQFFTDYYNTELVFPFDRYEIFAACDEARCHALGAQADVSGVFDNQQVDLEAAFGFGNQHKDHSGEFNSDNINRAPFWNTVLVKCKLKSP